ncbi:ABC transporter substrate-binding protein [Alicyclobacillus acidiphilus]|uniref:ABC transporter substrate-binding protein n=1 Tax=Alicyclobacillus acidiphilus TaxID=182455 RepID=UPI0009FA1DDA|nr:ABC transporter substrate-binding protein [Alicyclobacillus acidiphilus]
MKSAAKIRLSAGTAVVGLALVAGMVSHRVDTTSSSTVGAASTTATQGKSITILPTPSGNYADNFNPFAVTNDYGTFGFIYESLFYYDTQTGKMWPILGQSYKWSNGNKTLTVSLNPKAKWTDGQPFTANDVAFTFDLLKKDPSADTNGIWTQLSSVATKGDNTVIFNFKNANVPFGLEYVLGTYIVPQHIWSKISNPTKVTITNPVGTGPYVLNSFAPQDYTLKANPNYYRGKPPVPELNFPAFDSNASASLAMIQGEIDWAAVFMPNIQQVYAAKSPNNHYWFPLGVTLNLSVDLKNPLLNQAVVRRAMSMAINRNDLASKGEDGYDKPAEPDAVPYNMSSWQDPNLPAQDKSFSYNPASAEALLNKAGYKKNSSGILVSPSGKPLSFTLIVVAGWSDEDTDASLIADDLKKIGIQVNVKEVTATAYQNQLSAHQFQLAINAAYGGPNPYYVYQENYDPHGEADWMQFNNPTVNQALDQFAQTTDPTQQEQLVYKIERVVAEQLPTIPLLYGATWYEYNTSRYTNWPSASNAYISPSIWNYEGAAIVVMHLKPVN